MTKGAPQSESDRPGVNLGESPLAWLKRRQDKSGAPLITDEQFQAGERLRSDFWYAQMTPSTTTNWSAFGGGGRDRRALGAVGPELSGVLKGLEDAERAAGWPRRAGKEILKIARSALARHYGLIRPAPPPATGPARVRHWGTADYRPVIDAEV
jgi:hypothetical protein